jgi:hypothetical protein
MGLPRFGGNIWRGKRAKFRTPRSKFGLDEDIVAYLDIAERLERRREELMICLIGALSTE